MAVNLTPSTTAYGTEINANNIEQLEKDLARMLREGIPDAEAKALIDKLKAAGLQLITGAGSYTSINGGSTVGWTLQNWKDFLTQNKDKLRFGDGLTADPAKIQEFLNQLAAACDRAPDSLQLLRDSISGFKALKAMLDSGDIEGAVAMLQMNRATGLEQQIGAKMQVMNQRNTDIFTKNQKISDLQTERGKSGTSDARKAEIDGQLTTLNGEISKLNGDSQQSMIELQGLMTKRNEAYDTWSNVINKLATSRGNIIRNMGG